VRKRATMLRRSGSLQATSARLPARLCTIRCAAMVILPSSPSIAKSLIVNSRVEMPAVVTERSTRGAIISRDGEADDALERRVRRKHRQLRVKKTRAGRFRDDACGCKRVSTRCQFLSTGRRERSTLHRQRVTSYTFLDHLLTITSSKVKRGLNEGHRENRHGSSLLATSC
jgi:hypothetical protein